MKIVDKICEIFGLYSEDDELSLPEQEETKEEATAVAPMFGAKRWKERDDRFARKDKSIFGFSKEKSDDKLISMPLATKQVRVVVIEPVNFDDAQKVADYLRKNQPVVINFEDTDSDVMKRIIDFISGTVYALSGSLKKIGRSILVCAPQNVDIDAENTSYVDRGNTTPWGR